MSTQKLITLCFATVFALGLAACGGGGDAPVASMMDNGDTDDTMTSSLVGKIFPDGTEVLLPPGSTGDATLTYTAIEGESVTVVDVGTFECVTGPCMVVVANDAITSTGVIKVASLVDDIPAVILAALEEKDGLTPEELAAAQAGPDVAGLLLTAHNSRTAAETAEMAAAQAVKDAVKYSNMYSTAAALGDSMTATANAQKVFDAKAAADMAVMDAEAAKMAAETAKTEAGGIPADDPNRAAIMAALDASITAADDAIEAATESAEDMTLEAAYKAVIVDAKKPKDAGYHGEQVAKAIGGALGPDTDGGGTRHTHSATTNAAPEIIAADMKSAVQMDDATGMIWAQIVGEDNVTMSRLGGSNMNVPIASIAGMARSSIVDSDFGEGATEASDGTGFDGDYKDIPGTVHCLGTDCKVTDGKLAGSWYFQPTSPKAYYEKVGTDTMYTVEANYTRFGHWLTFSDAVATVNTYAWTDGNAEDVALNEDPMLDDSATYAGTAAGMSLHKTFDSQGEPQDLYSGRFTADVTLKADFDNTPTVKGTVDNFQGPATDLSWSVELKEMALGTSRGGTAGETSTGGTGADGQWNNQAYGVGFKRPTGILGDFTAHWTDGHVAGAYATRRE